MSTPRDVLERAFPAPDDALERLAERRRRRDQSRRLADGGVAIVLVLGLVMALLGAVTRQDRHEPAGPITPSNVGTLGLAWWGPTVPAVSQPVVAGDRVYVLSQDGTLQAFALECPSERCDPIWTARSGIGSSRPWGSAIVAGGRVYQPSSDGRWIGYPTSCDADPCEPDWIGAAAGDLTTADPAAGDGQIFVASDECCHGSRSYGRLFAFDETCASYPAPCPPSWTASMPSGFIGAQPVVVGGRVYVGSLGGTVYAFPTHCAPVGRRCLPVWTAETHGRGPENYGFGLPVRSLNMTPLVADGSSLYVAAGSSVYAFSLSCRDPSCPPRWIGHAKGLIGDITVSSGYVYASAGSDVVEGRGFPGGTIVFPTSCASRCEPVWTFRSEFSPTVADGVVYLLGGGPDDGAFDASCGEGGGGDACAPLWTMPPDNGASVTFPTVTSDSLYLDSTDGNLHVFRLGGTGTCCGPVGSEDGGHSIGYAAFYSALIGGIVWLAVRRRSRSSRVGVPG
jgi:outer membrane protein assembly factor BamB